MKGSRRHAFRQEMLALWFLNTFEVSVKYTRFWKCLHIKQGVDRFISLAVGKIKASPCEKTCSSQRHTPAEWVRSDLVWSSPVTQTPEVEGTPVQPPPVCAGRQGRDYSEVHAGGRQIKRWRKQRFWVPICQAAGEPSFLERDGMRLMSQAQTHKPPARVVLIQTCACSNKWSTAAQQCVYFELLAHYLKKKPHIRTNGDADPNTALMCCQIKAKGEKGFGMWLCSDTEELTHRLHFLKLYFNQQAFTILSLLSVFLCLCDCLTTGPI